jgi:hypothetical protein
VLAKVHDQQTIQKEVTKRKLSYKTTRRRPNSQNHHQKKKKIPFLEQRQSLTIEGGLRHKKLLGFKEEQNIYTTHQQPNKTNLLLDSPLFDLLYANIKARANSSVPKPPSDPRWRPATHRLNVLIFCGKNFPVDFIFGNERFPVNFVLATAAKGDQIHPHQVSVNRGNEDGIDRKSSR